MGDIDYAQIDPELRRIARILPKGYALHRGLAVPRALMALAGYTGRMRGVEVARVNRPSVFTVRAVARRPVRRCCGSTAAEP